MCVCMYVRICLCKALEVRRDESQHAVDDIYVYIYIYECVCACMYACVYVKHTRCVEMKASMLWVSYVCVRACACIHVFEYVNRVLPRHLSVTCIHAYVYVCMYVCMYVYENVCSPAYAYVCMYVS
jgi:hypothetical protein